MKKKILFVISSIGSIALIAGVTSIIAIDSVNPSKKGNQIDEKTAKQIVNKLNTLVENPIIIHSYLTANQALQSANKDQVKQLIKNALLKQLGNEKFTIGNVIFSAKQLVDYIGIELPSNSVSYSNFITGQITGVHLVFTAPNISIELMHQGSADYTVEGFSVPNKNTTTSKNIANQLNSLLS
ncbi:MAG: hypothetical protein IIT97_02345, partial [Mycoplasmataceae bacterium]|nr:hypothetical protein [Mycoplasmataceae bacterium]